MFQALGLLNKNVHVLSAYHVYLEKLYQIEQNRGDKNINNFVISDDENDEIIKFQNVSFKYFDSNKYIFEDLNLNFDKNKHTVITGPNGSGKSTLIGLLSGILYPEKGIVITSQCKFGYVGAKPMILNATLRENLLYGNTSEVEDSYIIELLERFKFKDRLVDELDILNKEKKVSEILSLKSYNSAKDFSLEKAAEKELDDYNKILVT